MSAVGAAMIVACGRSTAGGPGSNRAPAMPAEAGSAKRPCPAGTKLRTTQLNGGKTLECRNSNNVRHGPYTERVRTGGGRVRVDGSYRGGKTHGLRYVRIVAPTIVTLEIGRVRNGTKVGLHRSYMNGYLLEDTYYSAAGALTRDVNYHSNGRKSFEAHLKRGPGGQPIPHGVTTGWWDNGQKQRQGRFRNGKQVGTWRYWSPSGKPISKTQLDAIEKQRPAVKWPPPTN